MWMVLHEIGDSAACSAVSLLVAGSDPHTLRRGAEIAYGCTDRNVAMRRICILTRTLLRNAGCDRSKRECLSKLILFGEASLRRALTQFQEHYHSERNHQGKGNVLLFPVARNCRRAGDHQSSAASASAVFSSITTGGPHEFLDPSGSSCHGFR